MTQMDKCGGRVEGGMKSKGRGVLQAEGKVCVQNQGQRARKYGLGNTARTGL